jgi:hypothetical protein
MGWPGRGPPGRSCRSRLPGAVPGTGPRLPVGIGGRDGTVGRAPGAPGAAAAGRIAEDCVPVPWPGRGGGAPDRCDGGAMRAPGDEVPVCPAGATARIGVTTGALGAGAEGGGAAGFAAGASLAGIRAGVAAAGAGAADPACVGAGATPVAGATPAGGATATTGAAGLGATVTGAATGAGGAGATGAVAGLIRAALAAASFASFSALAAASTAASASATPWRCLRTFSATSTVTELECVFFSVTPYPGNRSMMALALTSSSRASSLIRT